jgi:RecJ-like exonuclease
MIKNKIGIETLILAMLLVSIVFVPAVSAQADISQNKEYADAIDISNKKSISKEDLKKYQKT